jgi:hypothetical protein
MGIWNRLFGGKQPTGKQSINNKSSGSFSISPNLVSILGCIYIAEGINEDIKKDLTNQVTYIYKSNNPDFYKALLKINPGVKIVNAFCSTQEEGLHIIMKPGANVAIQTRDIFISKIFTYPKTTIPAIIVTWFTKPQDDKNPSVVIIHDELIPE